MRWGMYESDQPNFGAYTPPPPTAPPPGECAWARWARVLALLGLAAVVWAVAYSVTCSHELAWVALVASCTGAGLLFVAGVLAWVAWTVPGKMVVNGNRKGGDDGTRPGASG